MTAVLVGLSPRLSAYHRPPAPAPLVSPPAPYHRLPLNPTTFSCQVPLQLFSLFLLDASFNKSVRSFTVLMSIFTQEVSYDRHISLANAQLSPAPAPPPS